MSDVLYDSGYRGQLISMAGVHGGDGRGLRIWSSQFAPTTAVVQVLGSAPERLYALITNDGAVDIDLAFDQSFNNGYHTIRPGGSMLINNDMPWTGPIYGRTAAGTGLGNVEGANVQP